MLETIALKLLLAIAEEHEESSTVSLATRIKVSQQSVSRVLQELTREEYVRKRPLASGLHLTLTAKGRLAMSELQHRLERALGSGKLGGQLHGTIETGLGEGKYYMSMPNYKVPLTELLGKAPHPGTLNVKVHPQERELFLSTLDCTEIQGFKSPERTYGGVKYYPVEVAGEPCGLIIPMRTTHGKERIELISPLKLRILLKVLDGDEITIERRKE